VYASDTLLFAFATVLVGGRGNFYIHILGFKVLIYISRPDPLNNALSTIWKFINSGINSPNLTEYYLKTVAA